MPIRSPFRVREGPEVRMSRVFISSAMMWERVVFPSPGGPWKRMWPGGSSRCRAASRAMRSFATISFWPTYSPSFVGRREVKACSSSGPMDLGDTRLSITTLALLLRYRLSRKTASRIASVSASLPIEERTRSIRSSASGVR